MAFGYDRFNLVASLGVDRLWRDALIKKAVLALNASETVLDIGTGTGDLIFELYAQLPLLKRDCKFFGLDFSKEMLKVAMVKGKRRPGSKYSLFLQGDAQFIPLRSESVDLVVSAFALRNMKKQVFNILLELQRVLKPNGKLLLLDMYAPQGKLLKALHRVYLCTMLGLAGRAIFAKRWAGSYLPETIFNFWRPEEFVQMLEKTGFVDVGYHTLWGGMAIVHEAKK